MDGDWKRLGALARMRRRSLGHSRADLAAIAHVSEGSIKNLENANGGKGYTRMPETLPDILQALGWAQKSAESILRGGKPIYLPDAAGYPTDEPHLESAGESEEDVILGIMAGVRDLTPEDRRKVRAQIDALTHLYVTE